MTIETKLQELYEKIENIPADKWLKHGAKEREGRGERDPDYHVM